jgi:hypothetical protein
MEAIILTKEQFTELRTKLDEINFKLNNNSSDKDKFIDNQQFVELMRISKRTAQSWRDEGKVTFSQIGAKIYYKLIDVEHLFQKHQNRAFNKK